MRQVLSVAALVLAAGTGWAQGRPEQAAPVRTPVAGPIVPASPLPTPGAATPAAPAVAGQEFCPMPEQAMNAPGGPNEQFWLRGEYLLWWVKGSQLPPLVTTGIPGATPLPGALGQTGTAVIYGGSDADNAPRSGGRFTAGYWCDPCNLIGVEGSYFFLCSRTTQFDVAANSALGSPFIARPFFDVLSGGPNAQLVAFPALAGGTTLLGAGGLGLASGDIHVDTYSRLQGAEFNALCGLCSGCNYRVLALGGFRYLQLEEGLTVTENTRVNAALPAGAPFFGGSTISMTDRFDTRNNFYGGQVGVRGEVRRGRVFVEAQGKVALGVTNQVVDIGGSTTVTGPNGVSTVTPVGFLASGSNSGRFERNAFAVVPEVGVNAGFQVTRGLRTFVGYNFLYWSSVVRPADQIDLGLSGTQIPTDTRFNPAEGPARPGVLARDTGFWVQGISFGAEFRF